MKSSNKLSRGIQTLKTCGWFCSLAASLLLTMASGGLVLAQETATPESEDSSKRVDESEGNYRQRMELREQRFNERPKITTTYAVQASEGKLDQLPPASKEHIKDQLRDMIIESRQWKPGEDITDYPYEPSDAAKTDPALHALEREAWVEQLQKHQEREAAAFANATGGEAGQPAAQGGEQGTGQQAQGQPGQDQSGQGQSGQGSSEKTAQASGGSPGASSQDQTGAQDDSESATGSERAAKAISTAGVSESALSFVQGKGGRSGGVAATNASAGDAAEGSSQDPSQAASQEGGSQAGAQDAAQVAQAANAGSGASASSAAGAGQEAKEEKTAEEKTAEEKAAEEKSVEQVAAAEVLAGTLAVDELQKVEGLVLQDAGQQPGSAGDIPLAGVESAPMQEPGTLSIDELQELDQ